MAKRAPDRLLSLLLGGASPFKVPAPPPGATDPMLTVLQAGVEALAEFWVGATGLPRIRDRVLQADIEALKACLAYHARDSLEDVLDKITVPCLLFAGEKDPEYPGVKKAAELIPGARFASFHDLNHFRTFSRGDITIPLITQFLDSIT